MVDSVGGAGGPQSVAQLRAQQNQSQRNASTSGGSGTASPVDQVNLSEEALSLAQVEGLLAQTRQQVESGVAEGLSGGRVFDQDL